MSNHDDWLRAADDACSYRRNYALAQEISIETIDLQLRMAADDVVEALKDVVGLAIAPSDTLKETRRRFTVLTNVLAGAPEMEQFVPSAGSPVEQVEELLCQILEKVANRTAHELPAIRTMRVRYEADKEGVSNGMVKDTIKEVGHSREKVENELDRKKSDLMSVQSLQFVSVASSQMVRSAVRQQAGYQPPDTDDAFRQLLNRLSQAENAGDSTDTGATRPCSESE